MPIKPTQARFIAWLKGQSGVYEYFDNTHCPWARFLKACGFKDVRVFGFSWQDANRKTIPIPAKISEALVQHPHFYEELLGRLKRKKK